LDLDLSVHQQFGTFKKKAVDQSVEQQEEYQKKEWKEGRKE
jgi:hypothetical protein